MWFKRRKKSDQDHALSESLKSLQTLLNDTGRVEPTLEGGDHDARQGGDSGGAGDRRQPRLSSRRGPDDPDEERGDARLRSPARSAAETADSGNRWKDLNLAFDAEPVPPRTRRNNQTEDQQSADSSTEAGAETGPAGREVGSLPPASPEAAAPPASEPAPESEPGPAAETEPAPEPLPEPERNAIEDLGSPRPLGPTVDETSGGGEGRSPELDLHEFAGPSAAEPELEIDLDAMGEQAAPAPEPPELPGDEEPPEENAPEVEEIELAAPPDETLYDNGMEAGQTPNAAPAASPADEPGENQLHLELESEAASQDEIPTLTDAVYVPEAPAGEASVAAARPRIEPEPESTPEPEAEPAQEREPEPVQDSEPRAAAEQSEPEAVAGPGTPPEAGAMPELGPGPAESPYDQDIDQCLERLRVRLQLMGLGVLSEAQEKELRDTLVEFFDER